MKVGNVIQVKGLSLKGRNRIKEHGNEWEVIKVGSFANSPAVLLQSVKTLAIRWMNTPEDCDFKALCIVPSPAH